jgi:hypothetical protein
MAVVIVTVSVLCVVCVAIGWVARGLRSKRRDAVYGFQHQTPALKIRADKLTEDELTRFVSNLDASFEKLKEQERLEKVRTWATVSTSVTGTRNPHVFVQWKGTDVCLDFFCDCGGGGHYDGDFAYGLRCSECRTEWLMPHTFGLLPDADGAIQDTDMPHQERPTTDKRFAEIVDEEDGDQTAVEVDLPFARGGWIGPANTDSDSIPFVLGESGCLFQNAERILAEEARAKAARYVSQEPWPADGALPRAAYVHLDEGTIEWTGIANDITVRAVVCDPSVVLYVKPTVEPNGVRCVRLVTSDGVVHAIAASAW